MKIPLITLAALASATAAFAQSSVTIYGRLDEAIARSSGGLVGGGNYVAGTGLAGSFNQPTVIGFKGSEDLGGGLKANFQLESSGLDNNTGGAGFGNFGFTRFSWVGLSGNFGGFRLGRQTGVPTFGTGYFDANGVSSTSAPATVGLSPVGWYGTSKRSSLLYYYTPNFNGFDAGVSYVTHFDAGGAVPNSGAGSVVAARVNYANGPLAVGFTAEQAHLNTNRTAYALAGSYDLGAAKLFFGLDRSENTHGTYTAVTTNCGQCIGSSSVDTNGGQGYWLGVSAPFGATTVGAQYANNTADGAKALELFANYDLSKRTFLYANYVRGTFTNTPGVSTSTITDLNRFAVGIQHSF